MLKISGLNQYYGGSHILRDLEFEIPLGACTTVLGRNAASDLVVLKVDATGLPTLHVASATTLRVGATESRMFPVRVRLDPGVAPESVRTHKIVFSIRAIDDVVVQLQRLMNGKPPLWLRRVWRGPDGQRLSLDEQEI